MAKKKKNTSENEYKGLTAGKLIQQSGNYTTAGDVVKQPSVLQENIRAWRKKKEEERKEAARKAFMTVYGPEKKFINTMNQPRTTVPDRRTTQTVQPPAMQTAGTVTAPAAMQPARTATAPAGGKYGPYASDQQVVNNWLRYVNGQQPQNNAQTPRASDEQILNNFLNQQLQRRAAIENQTPTQQYAALKPEEQSRWMRPQSNAVQEILSYKNAKDYVNRHWNDQYKDLETEREEAEKSLAASNEYLQNATMTQQEAWDAIQSPIIKNQLMRTLPKNLLERPEDYDENPEYYNEMLYDTYRGKGAYQRVMMTGNQNDKQQMKDDLAELWAEVDSGRLRTAYDVENGLWKNENRYDTEQANANYQTKKLKGIATKEKQRDEYNALISQYGEPTRPDFVPEYDRGGQAYGSMKELESGVHTDDVHRIYSFLGGGKEYQAFAAGTNPRVSTEYSYAMMMTDGSNGSNNEIGIFMDLYNQAVAEGREPTEASAFLKGLQPALQSRYNDEFEKIQIAEASKIAPGSASIGSLMMKQANTYLDIPRHVANWLGDKSTEDYNSWWYAPARQSEQIEENIANNIGGFGGKIYKNVMNSLSNMTRALTTPGSGKVAKSILSLGGFFLQVDQEATARYLKNNDYDTAQKLGALDAAFEVCEEFLPFETMLGSVGKNMGLAILQNALSEAGQEFGGATVFEKLKGIITGEDSEDERIAEILHDGFYIDKNGNKVTLDKDEGVRLQQARVQAGKEFWDQAIENGLAGAFGGGLGGMYGTIGTGIGIEEYGKQIKNEKNEVKGKSGAWRLAELGAKMGEKSKARQTAEWIQADILAGKNPSNFRLGKLAMQIVEETEGKSESVISQTINQTVKEQLVRNGVEESEAGQFADVIARNLTKTKGRMAKEDIETLSKSQAAIDLWKSYYTADRKNLQEIRTNVKEATKEQRQTIASIEDLTRTTAYATSSVADAVESSLQATRTDEEAIDHLAKNRGDILSEEYAAKAKEILEKDADAKKSKSFVDDVMKIRMAVYTMKEEMPETNLSEDAVSQLRKAAQEEFDAEDELRFQNQQTIKPGEGKADFDGVEYGTEEWKKAVKDKGLSNKQIRRLQVQAEIGKRMGFTTHVFYDNSQAGLKKQGYEIAQTGEIYINAATDMRHHMLVTMSHEMTHWLEQNNREAYNELRKFVVKGLQDRGIDVEKQLLRAIDNQRYAQIMEREQNGGKSSISDLTLMGAMQELVAKSCENLLSSQAFEQELKEKNPTLHGKIKEYIQSFVANLRKAVEGMDESLSREAYAMLDQTEEIAKIWLKGYNQALGDENTGETAATAEGQAQLSVENIAKESEQARSYRLTKQGDKVRKDISKWKKNTTITVADLEKMVGNDMYDSLQQWIHNRYGNNKQAKIERSHLDSFLTKDAKRIREGSGNVVKAWKQMINSGESIYEIKVDPVKEKITLPTDDEISRKLFGSLNGSAEYLNNKTKGYITADYKTVQETMERFRKLHVPQSVTKAIMDNFGTLIENATYYGSHVNYANEKGEVHYYASNIEVGKYREHVVFAVHTKTHTNQDYDERAYIADVYLIKKKEGPQAPDTRTGNKSANENQALPQMIPSANSIEELLQNVKTDRIRSFDINKLAGSKMSLSVAEMDKEYDKAVKSGDMETAQEDVDFYAEQNGFDTQEKAYHGTDSFGFTEFDMEQSQDMIFVAYSKDMAGTYVSYEDPSVKKVSEAVKLNRPVKEMSGQELFETAKKYLKTIEGSEVLSIDYDPKSDMYTVTTDESNYFDPNATVTQEFIEYDIKHYLQSSIDELNAGIYQFYTRPGKQLVIDADSTSWDDISVPFNDETMSTREIAEWARNNGYDSVRINGIWDYGGNGPDLDGYGDIGIFFNQNDVKSADPVTYDDNGNVIPLDQRFSDSPDIRYSVAAGEDPVDVPNSQGDAMFTILPGNTIAATEYSLSSYYDLKERTKMINALKKAGYDEQQITDWIEDLDSIAAKIATDRLRYDFVADRRKKFLKPNGDVYKKTIDASTMCKKTRLYNGTFNVVQHLLPNTALLPEDLIKLYNIMKDMGLETPCKFCYVQSRRRHLGTYAEDWLKRYKGEYVPRIEEVTTSDGLAKLKKEHPKTAGDFVRAMNRKGVNNPKLVQERTDYRGEIRRMKEDTIKYLNEIGGLRIQSFSDFEVVHMLDMMQVVMDMKAKKLAGQAYTKIPEFAWVFGKTGIKINLSLVGRGSGLNAKGELVFDNEEGIDSNEAMALRKAYSKNVGTVLVGINDKHIIAAMGDDRIDFIIPFHKSGWSENELKNMRGLEYYDDYTDSQNEYDLTWENGKMVKTKAESNIDPLSYWEFEHDGEYNARKYLQLCKDQHIQPKFSQFLTDNGDGSWSLPEGNDRDSMNIRKGYWKTLIDFKMYDNEGNGAKQEIVHPDFNMDAANRILDEYDGSHQTLPESWEAANAFVDWYKAEHPLDNVRTQYSVEDAPDMDVERFMLGLNELHMNSVQEKAMHRQFRELKGDIDAIEFKISERQRMIDKIMRKKEISVYDREQLRKIENLQNYDRERLAQKKKEYIRVTTKGGYAELMKKNARLMDDVVTGRTAEELNSTVEAMNRQMDDVTREMEARRKTIEALAESEGVLAVRTQFNRAGLKRIAAKLKSDLQSDLSLGEIENRLALIALKMKEGKYDKETTEELAGLITGKMRSNYDGYVISQLRGKTITLGPVQLKELRGQDRTLAEIRKELTGTGIMISSKGNVTLDEEWEELCDLFPSLDRTTSPGGQLDALMGIIKNEMRMSQSQYMADEGLMQVTQTVLEAARDLMPEIVTDAKSLKLIRDTLEYVHDVAATARGTAQGLADVENLMKNLQKTGKQAGEQAIHIGNNMLDVISYYNALGEQSEAALWKRERAALIAQLKSENTQNMLEEQAKWKAKIAKDRAAKGMQEGNLQIRKRITTNYSRLRKLMIAETDQKNVPEHMKGLAREMLRLLTENDLAGRKITGMARKDLTETLRVLDIMDQQDGRFTEDDLKLINDEEAQAAVLDALANLEDGIKFYNASTRGYDIMTNLQAFKNALGRVDDAVTTICNVIGAERTISLKDRLIPIVDAAADIRKGMENSRHKGEWKGRGSKAVKAVKSSVVYGNTTPEYFIKNLRNAGMEEQWDEARRGENRYGLEVQKAQDYMKELAEKTNYKAWENEKKEVTMGGRKRAISVQNIMEIYAIWQREKTTNPEMSQHLNKGGVYIQEDENQEGRLHRERQYLNATRLSDDEVLDMYNLLTQDQKDWLDGMVKYLSNDMSDLGNEASMRMYGIKKYKESYYFPMKVWDGVKSARSDKGITGTTENRAANKSWSKRRQHMASNALVIGNFTQDAVNHIVEMINYNTMAPAIENLNKVLNFQFTEGEDMDSTTKRNMRVLFQEAYGKEALSYLETLMKDMNGGLVQDQRKTLRDKALSIFKKNAVAGSMSVALQQPLSYIRAAMMINPKYLAQGLSPRYWKGSAAEMNKYSGVAVIKDMGKFDMNFGSSAKEYITPEGKNNAYEKVSDLVTMAPALMDKMTWTRMWSAVKMEQHALHKDMDMGSDEFLRIVAERFNEVMRKTQVYDSILVKSSNMRSQNFGLKMITSFMAEPTLSLNVLADAVRNVSEKGGKTMLARAGATFALSAVCQAIVKGLMGSGRTPDKKKTWLENFLNKLQYNLMNEINPFSLIPGYSDLIETLKTGKLQDDAMGAIGKLVSVIETAQNAAQGKGESIWRDIEDTAGQVAQLFTNIPAKNIMRDLRAMYNWFNGDTYAERESSDAVLKYQAEANLYSGDNMLGVLNAWLGEAGFKSSAKEYYGRMYDAMKNGNQDEAEQIREYLMLGKGVKAESIDSGIKAAAKADDSMTDAEKTGWMIDAGMTSKLSDVTGQYRDGKLTKAEAKKLMKQMDPQISENDLFWELDRVDFQKETGAEKKPSGYGYRLAAAVNANDTEKIRSAVKDLLAHGLTKEKLKKDYFGDWKKAYLEADTAGKRKIINAITTAYKAAGYTAEDAQKAIDSWNKEKKKKN